MLQTGGFSSGAAAISIIPIICILYHLYGLIAWWAILLALTISDKHHRECETAAEMCRLKQNSPYFSWVHSQWPILCAVLRYNVADMNHTWSNLYFEKDFSLKLLYQAFMARLGVKSDFDALYCRLIPRPRSCNLMTNCTLTAVSCHRQMHESAL